MAFRILSEPDSPVLDDDPEHDNDLSLTCDRCGALVDALTTVEDSDPSVAYREESGLCDCCLQEVSR